MRHAREAVKMRESPSVVVVALNERFLAVFAKAGCSPVQQLFPVQLQLDLSISYANKCVLKPTTQRIHWCRKRQK